MLVIDFSVDSCRRLYTTHTLVVCVSDEENWDICMAHTLCRNFTHSLTHTHARALSFISSHSWFSLILGSHSCSHSFSFTCTSARTHNLTSDTWFQSFCRFGITAWMLYIFFFFVSPIFSWMVLRSDDGI